MRLGTANKKLATHKEGATTWSYVEGKLVQTVDGQARTLSAQHTLALCNLLYSHYAEIVTAAREEQRKAEKEQDKRKSHSPEGHGIMYV